MTRRFTAHELRPVRDAQAKPPPAVKPDKAEKPGAESGSAKVGPETGGPSGPEPTRYGDWERKGICVDF